MVALGGVFPEVAVTATVAESVPPRPSLTVSRAV